MRDGPHPKLSGDRDDLGQPCPDPAVSVSAHFRLSSPPSPLPPQAAAAVVPASAGRRVVASRRAWWNSGRQGEVAGAPLPRQLRSPVSRRSQRRGVCGDGFGRGCTHSGRRRIFGTHARAPSSITATQGGEQPKNCLVPAPRTAPPHRPARVGTAYSGVGISTASTGVTTATAEIAAKDTHTLYLDYYGLKGRHSASGIS